MGWGNCGIDNLGRPIGYEHDATCDHPECNRHINRGLSHVCGGMHGDNEVGYGRYFCAEHLTGLIKDSNGNHQLICSFCESGAEVPERQLLLGEVNRLVCLYNNIVLAAENLGINFDKLKDAYHRIIENE